VTARRSGARSPEANRRHQGDEQRLEDEEVEHQYEEDRQDEDGCQDEDDEGEHEGRRDLAP